MRDFTGFGFKHVDLEMQVSVGWGGWGCGVGFVPIAKQFFDVCGEWQELRMDREFE